VGFVPFLVRGFLAARLGLVVFFLSLLVVLMPSYSLSPLSSVSFAPSSIVVSRLGWDSASRSILLWSEGSAVPVVCRTGGAGSVALKDLTALLRESRDFGVPIYLGVRKGWDGARWFCAASTIEPAFITELGLPDWEYYGFSSPEQYVEGEGCGVEGCCV